MSHSRNDNVARVARIAVAAAVLACGGATREAFARKQYSDEFRAMYVKPDSSDPAEKALAAEVESVKCNVCHKGSNKKERNVYGEALSKLLEKNVKDVETIKKAFEDVAGLPSDPANAGSPTFGSLIKEGKLPGGK